MSRIVYEIVRHDWGWAYRLGDVYSETYPTHDDARDAAKQVAREQRQPGETTEISWEDENGRWHTEMSDGGDRPDPDVTG